MENGKYRSGGKRARSLAASVTRSTYATKGNAPHRLRSRQKNAAIWVSGTEFETVGRRNRKRRKKEGVWSRYLAAEWIVRENQCLKCPTLIATRHQTPRRRVWSSHYKTTPSPCGRNAEVWYFFGELKRDALQVTDLAAKVYNFQGQTRAVGCVHAQGHSGASPVLPPSSSDIEQWTRELV